MRLGLTILLLIVAATIFAPLLTPYDPLHAESGAEVLPPSTTHLLGTDLIGRDILSRLLYGGTRSLLIAALATLITLVPGVLLGITTGYIGGWPDRIGLVLINVLLALPGLLLALCVIALAGSSPFSVILAVGLSGIASFARLMRIATRRIRVEAYIEAAQAIGVPRRRILTHYLLPNLLSMLASYTGVTFSYALLNASTLSFLGFGGEPAVPDWGVMIAENRQLLRGQPMAVLGAGFAVALTIFAVNRVSDSLGSAPRT